jgi:hypothetical protein
VARNNGLPEAWLHTPEEIAEIQQGRAEANQQAQQMAMAEQAASAAQKLSSAAPGLAERAMNGI